jgi:hypothetical protein
METKLEVMKNELNLDELKETYLVSNTASFLLENLSSDESILSLINNYSTAQIIKCFSQISRKKINEIDDLVFAYALYIAIILKSDSLSYNFLKNKGIINFEWFVELRNIFLTKYNPLNIFII